MTEQIDRILSQYGQQVTIERGETKKEILAFLQSDNNEAHLESAADVLGQVDERRYRYLGREKLSPGDSLIWNKQRLQVQTVVPYYIGSELSHYQAVLIPDRRVAAC